MNDNKSDCRTISSCCGDGDAQSVVGSIAVGSRTCCGRAVLFLLLLLSSAAFAANDDMLGMLQIGDHTYQNVTVRTKAKDYIFIVHSAGMTNIKVSQLPGEVLEKLGYVPTAKRQTSPLASLTGTSVTKGTVAFVDELKARLPSASTMQELRGHSSLILALAIVLLITHLFFSYCCLLICRKTGTNAGILVWLPLLQIVPMLRAASMSVWWLAALFVPGLNLFGYGLWSIRIVKARQKTTPLAMLLIFPLTSWFAFLFLALSNDTRDQGVKVQVESMSLQTVCNSASRDWTRVLSESERHIVA